MEEINVLLDGFVKDEETAMKAVARSLPIFVIRKPSEYSTGTLKASALCLMFSRVAT